MTIVIINTPMHIEKKKRGRPLNFDREQALKNAMLVFWRLGYGGASIADLTVAMGISAQSLYASFGSKSDLYYESLELYQKLFCAKVYATLQQNNPFFEAIEHMLLETACMYTDATHPPGCMIATPNIGCAVENCDEAAHVSRLRKEMVKRIQNRVELGIKAGELLRSKTDAVMLSTYLSTLIQGMSEHAQDGASEEDLRRMIKAIMQMLVQNYAAK